MVTVQSLAKKRKASWQLLKIKNQFLSPVPFPPRKARREGEFFCGVLQAGVARLQNPLIFSPPPQRAQAPLGRGLGEGQKLRLTKVHPSPSSYLTPG